MSDYEIKMTNKAIQYHEWKLQIERIKDNMANTLAEMDALMTEQGASSFETLVDETTTLVVERQVSRKKQCNKEEMASDLGVSTGALKTEFLLKCAIDGKLTSEQYGNYFFHEFVPTTKVKKRKPKKEKKKRGKAH